MPATIEDFCVSKTDLRLTRWLESQAPVLEPEQLLLEIDCFALTANNITYAVAGERMSYWNFFPTEQGLGRVPVWGFANVVESAHADVTVGERVYGYFPMSSHLVIRAGRVSERSLIDASAHRSKLPGVYNQYLRVASDPSYEPSGEAMQMLFRPLYMTSFILDDFLADNDCFGAENVILTSASSKTSLGLAFLLHANRDCQVIGLTSESNRVFVEALGCYHTVLSYEEIDTLARVPSVIVDMAGNGTKLAGVHNHLDAELRYSCLVGATHWEARQGSKGMAGPRPELFFAPTHIQKRNEDWGPGGVEARFSDAWERFTSVVGDWITVRNVEGRNGVERTYMEMLNGQVTPDIGYVLSVRET
ncbi:MAG: DUF2855 family protein [Gammaproteobacteria bacterium]|nr:DUF2855 family protein [Gammaproteobacteria bacterium]